MGNQISRIHCKLIHRYFFSSGFAPRKKLLFLAKYLKAKGLPSGIFLQVYLFLRPKKAIYLQDLGSRTGTFRRLRPNEQITLENGSSFQLGNNVTFVVLYVKEQATSKLMRHILGFPLDRCKFHGFATSQPQPDVLQDTPFLVLRNLNHDSQAAEFVFLKATEGQGFLFGRAERSDVVVNFADISRRHCVIAYKEGTWALSDGVGQHRSFNGTWFDISKRGPSRKKSPRYELLDNDDFKVGDYLFNLRTRGRETDAVQD